MLVNANELKVDKAVRKKIKLRD